MQTLLQQLDILKKQAQGCWPQRAVYEMEYALRLSEALEGKHQDIVRSAVQGLYQSFQERGCITEAAAREAEAALLPMAEEAKSFHMICAAHAHIDMNWMWRYDETVAITLDTFRTMLDLMEEYPTFTFSQSQASVYRIVQQHDPAMLEEIKACIRQGRWEVTASTWVETDKNMPSGESLARHILYTKRVLSQLLEVDPVSLKLDFEPDTFGHSAQVPEILDQGGVKYYYHCRGYDGHRLYRWKAPARSSVLVYREPLWYNAAIEPSMALYVPEFCIQHSMDTMLKVYGVGDHGGGPTRRDIERILDMAEWPVFPSIRFGTYAEFYEKAEEVSDQLPVVHGELNFVFTGCYTTQTRIKAGNRLLEAKLGEAEALAAAAALSGDRPYPGARFAQAWEKVLFNQFHDILPGSGTADTREYALGLYQDAMAIADTEESLALRAIADRIDTSDIDEGQEIHHTTAEGAGVGFGLSAYELPQTERGRGITRVYHLFNAAPYARREMVEITLWDWEGDPARMEFSSEGRVLPHQLLSESQDHYWGHHYRRVILQAEMPPMGYITCILREKPLTLQPLPLPMDPRVEVLPQYVLENEFIRAAFDPATGALVSLTDKSSGQEAAQGEGAGIFRYVEEDESRGMTAWVVGRYRKVRSIHEDGITWAESAKGTLRQSLSYKAQFGSSELVVAISLDKSDRFLHFDIKCKFLDIGGHGRGIPQLQFYMPAGYACRAYRYDIPSGIVEREALDMDVPGLSFAAALPKDPGRKPLTLMTQTKYGFRGYEDSLTLTLIRAAFDPDPYPEFGDHRIRFAVGLPDVTSNRELLEASYNYNHPIRTLSARPHPGELLKTGSFMALEEGSVALQAMKMAEEGNGLVLRLIETEGRRTKAALRFCRRVAQAEFIDINEHPISSDAALSVSDSTVHLTVEPCRLISLSITFAD